MRKPTPMRAIRARCLDCSETLADIRECWNEKCALWPYRMAHRPPASERAGVPGPLRSIRRYCRWCMLDQASEVRECPSTDCPLHIYRAGHRPALESRVALES